MALGLDDPRPMRKGVRTSRHVRPVAHDEIDGLRCASVPETLLACARWVSLIDLVVLLDCVLHTEQASVRDIEEVMTPRRPGGPALRRALALADGRSESVFETLTRLLHVLCGIDVEPQFVVVDEHGEVVARLDLLLTGTNAGHEYDGDEHEEASRRVKDRRRDRTLERLGFVRRAYTAGDILHRGVGVLRDADRSLGRPHDPSRIHPWLDELRTSLFMSSGQASFLARVTSTPTARRRLPSDGGSAA